MIFENKILDVYRSVAFSRCDDKGTSFYFSASDFEGLNEEKYPFKSKRGESLSGRFYYYDGYNEKRIIVFDHGMGGGHRAYMREIELLCKHGYRVFAYDHTGCMESEGENTGGMGQSLSDLDDALNTLSKDARYSSLDVSVMGHSWGGYSTLNIIALHPEISHAVVLSGFISVRRLVNSFIKGILSVYRKAVMKLEEQRHVKTVHLDATQTLQNSEIPILLIYSDNDALCTKKRHYDPLFYALSHKKNIRFMLEHGKGHNPNYTEDAVAYLGKFLKAKAEKEKRGELKTEEEKKAFVSSFDFKRMTEQDSRVWKEIFKTLDE